MGHHNIKAALNAFLADDSGATAIEYALLIGLLSIAIILSLTSIGTGIANKFEIVGNTIERQKLNTGRVD